MNGRDLHREVGFGEFVLYPDLRQLFRGGRPVRACRPQHAAFLALLLEAPGQIVTKDALKARLWPGELPTKNRLNALASAVWALLGDTRRDRRKYFVATGREGYCFIHPVDRREVLAAGALDLAEKACRAGRQAMNDRQEARLRQAIAWFKRAIEHLPSHGPAWVGLAEAYITAGIHCVYAPREAFENARAASREAMQFESCAPEAAALQAWITLCYDRDWRAAEAGFRRGLEERPGYPVALNGLGLWQQATGQVEAAVESMERAHRLHPLSAPLTALLGYCYYLAGDFENAIDQGRRAVAADPQSCIARATLAQALLVVGRGQEAWPEFDEARRLSNDSRIYLGFWAYAAARLGMRMEAESALQRLLTPPRHEYVPSYFVALIHLGLGRPEACLDWLARACEERAHWVLFMRTEPIFHPLREHPRFEEIRRRVESGNA